MKGSKKWIEGNKRCEKNKQIPQVRFRWRIKKLDTHKGVVVDILLDSGAIGLFIDSKFVREQEFKLDRLE